MGSDKLYLFHGYSPGVQIILKTMAIISAVIHIRRQIADMNQMIVLADFQRVHLFMERTDRKHHKRWRKGFLNFYGHEKKR